MSSILRTYSQIPVREKYLLAIAAGDISGNLLGNSAFTLVAGDFIEVGSVATVSKITTAGFTSYSLVSGDLFKDLGRQITVYNSADNSHLAIYRQVQVINGAETEGVCNAANYCANIFVKVWSADGNNVKVVRTG